MEISYKDCETCKSMDIAVGDVFRYDKSFYMKTVDKNGIFGFVNLHTGEFILMNNWNENKFVQPVKVILKVDCYE